MKNNKNKSRKSTNPEIIREREEKRKMRALYDDEDDMLGTTLYPGVFLGSTVSATESTGLIQVPPTPDMMDVYDDVYSYRRTEPVADSEFWD